MNYGDYHSHPINKLFHIFCIPAIILSSCNLLSLIKIKIVNIEFESQEIIMFMMLLNYYNVSVVAFLVMIFYFLVIYSLALLWRSKRPNYMKESLYIFIGAWIVQLLGHYIEGKKPALIDGIFQAFNEAPLFSVSYLLPFKIV